MNPEPNAESDVGRGWHMCEYIGCDNEGWVVLHFGPKLTPPLRVACQTHRTETDLSKFWRCSCGAHVIVEGTVPDPGCPSHGVNRDKGTRVTAPATCPHCGHTHTPEGCVTGATPVVCECGVWDNETCPCGHGEELHERETDPEFCLVCGDADRCVTTPDRGVDA